MFPHRLRKAFVTYNRMHVTLPYHHDNVTIRHVSEHLMRFTLEGGIDILWDGIFFIEITLSHRYSGQVVVLITFVSLVAVPASLVSASRLPNLLAAKVTYFQYSGC